MNALEFEGHIVSIFSNARNEVDAMSSMCAELFEEGITNEQAVVLIDECIANTDRDIKAFGHLADNPMVTDDFYQYDRKKKEILQRARSLMKFCNEGKFTNRI